MLAKKTVAPRGRLADLTEPPLGVSEDDAEQSRLHGTGRVVATSGPKRVTRGSTSSIQKPNDLQCFTSNVASGHPVTGQTTGANQTHSDCIDPIITETFELSLGGVHHQQERRPTCNTNAAMLPVIDDGGHTEEMPEGLKERNCPTPLHSLPRSNKTTKFNVSSKLPELQHSPCPNEGSAVKIDFLLTIEGRDLRLPPPRTPTGPRRLTEKSKSRLNTERNLLDFGLQNDDEIISLEESLKTLLLCQSMGIIIEITRQREESEEQAGVAHAMFHCRRCLKYWTDYGRPPPECRERESRVRGPSFTISTRSHDILKKFSSLAPDDKLCFLEAIRAGEPSAEKSPPRQSPQVHVIHPLDESQENNTGAGAAHGMLLNAPGQTDGVSNSPLALGSNANVDSGSDAVDHNAASGEPRVVSRQLEGAVLTEVALDQGDVAGGPAKAFGPITTVLQESSSGTAQKQTNSTDLSSTKTAAIFKDRLITDGAGKQEVTTQSFPSNRESTLRNTKWYEDDNKRKTNKLQGHAGLVEAVDLITPSPANDHPTDTNASDPLLVGQKFSQEDYVKDINVTTSDRVARSEETNLPSTKEDPRSFSSDKETQQSITKVTITRTGLHLSHSNNKTASTSSDKDYETASNESLGDNLNGTPPPPKPVNLEQHSSSQFSTGESQQMIMPGRRSRTDKHRAREESSGSRHTLSRKSVHRDSIASSIGVMNGDDQSGLNHSPSTQNSAMSKENHEKIANGGNKTSSSSQKVVPIRNPAVRNVTGKPDTRPGTLKHMFATPTANLTQTNAVGMIPKTSGELLDVCTVPKSKMEDLSGAKTKGSATNTQLGKPSTRRESVVPGGNAARQLPPLSGNHRQLPPLTVPDTEQKSKGSDKRRALGVPKADEIVDRQTEQRLGLERTGEQLPALNDIQREQNRKISETKGKQKSKDRAKHVKRPPVAQEREGITSSTEGAGQESKPAVQGSLSSQNLNVEEHMSKVGTNILPLIEPTKDLVTEQENDRLGTKSPLKNLLNQFENFELSLSPPPASSLPPVSKADKSYRMTYSTLPKTFDWDTSRQPPALTRGTPSPQPLGLLNDFLEQPAGYSRPVDARLKGTSALRRQSGDIYDKSARTPSRVSGRRTNFSVSTSSSKSSQVSAAESLWESVSEIWRRHTLELQKLERMVALNFLPLTSAFTFSLFELPSQYLAQNRALREQAMQLRTLKKPKKIVFKFAPKPKKTAAIRRPAKLVK